MSSAKEKRSEVAVIRRAAHVGDMKHVQAWIEKLRKLARTMPPEIEVYVAAGTPHAMALSPKGESYMTDPGGRDQNAIVATVGVRGSRWDGGDW